MFRQSTVALFNSIPFRFPNIILNLNSTIYAPSGMAGISKKQNSWESLFVCFKGRNGYRGLPWFPLCLTNRICICRVPQKLVSSLHTTGVYEKPGPHRKVIALLFCQIFKKLKNFSFFNSYRFKFPMQFCLPVNLGGGVSQIPMLQDIRR